MIEPDQRACPYVGLVPYSEEDWPFFFGRDSERKIVTANLEGARLTLLYGPSGVGKTSLLSAGVVHNLNQLTLQNMARRRQPEFVVVMLKSWADDPLTSLAIEVQKAVARTLNVSWNQSEALSGSLEQVLQECSKRVGGRLLIILDQFEQYFLYHSKGNGSSGFAGEFPRAVNNPDLHASFLISIREDALAKLDRFTEDIPNLFDNYLRIEHINPDAARMAIKQPIEKYNHLYAADGQEVSFEETLVDEVINQIIKLDRDKTENRVAGDNGEERESESRIEAYHLQLVMHRLWDEEMRSGSRALRLATLTRLGGVHKIVQTHVVQAMENLSRKERRMAASVFPFLVTPSGTRFSQMAADLARSAELDKKQLNSLLEKLTSGNSRILQVTATDQMGEQRYDISHDVLAQAVERWRSNYAMKAKRAKRWRLMVTGLVIASLLAVSFFIAARNYRAAAISYEKVADSNEKVAISERRRREAMQAGNANSRVLARLYGLILGSEDKEQIRAAKDDILKTLDRGLEFFKKDADPVGVGITLNNIAGVHRIVSDAYRSKEEHGKAQDSSRRARDYYEQAQHILKSAIGPDQPDIATSLTGLAILLVGEGKYAEAEPLFKESMVILDNALRPDDRSLADAIKNLAECYNSQGKYADAEPLFDRAMEIRRGKLGESHPEFGESLNDLAWLYLEQGKYNKAEARFKQALAIWENMLEPDREQQLSTLVGLSEIYRRRQKYDEAAQYVYQAMGLHKDYIAYDRLLAAYDLENLALIFSDQGKTEAQSIFEGVLDTRMKALGEDHLDTALAKSNLAFYYHKQSRKGDIDPQQKIDLISKAETLFKQALEVQRALPYSPHLALTLHGLARLYSDQSMYADAEPLFEQAVAIQEKATPDHTDLADTLKDYAALLRNIGQERKALELESRAQTILDNHARENSNN